MSRIRNVLIAMVALALLATFARWPRQGPGGVTAPPTPAAAPAPPAPAPPDAPPAPSAPSSPQAPPDPGVRPVLRATRGAPPVDAHVDGEILPEPLPDASVWPLTADGLRGAMAEAGPHLEDCYEDALARRPGLDGAAYVTAFLNNVQDMGVITEVHVDSDLGDQALVDCVLDVTSRLAFDAPTDGGLQITMPLQFSPEAPP